MSSVILRTIISIKHQIEKLTNIKFIRNYNQGHEYKQQRFYDLLSGTNFDFDFLIELVVEVGVMKDETGQRLGHCDIILWGRNKDMWLDSTTSLKGRYTRIVLAKDPLYFEKIKEFIDEAKEYVKFREQIKSLNLENK